MKFDGLIPRVTYEGIAARAPQFNPASKYATARDCSKLPMVTISKSWPPKK